MSTVLKQSFVGVSAASFSAENREQMLNFILFRDNRFSQSVLTVTSVKGNVGESEDVPDL